MLPKREYKDKGFHIVNLFTIEPGLKFGGCFKEQNDNKETWTKYKLTNEQRFDYPKGIIFLQILTYNLKLSFMTIRKKSNNYTTAPLLHDF